MAYQPTTTIVKGAPPLAIVILVNVLLSVLKAKGIDVPADVVWQLALAGYGGYLALVNWLKHRKDDPEPAKG